MKAKLCALIAIAPCCISHAKADAQYGAQIGRLKANEAAIANQILSLRGKYGFAPESDGTESRQTAEASKPKLITVHGDIRSSLLPTGKLLFGKTLSRLVVSGEGAPVLVELEPQQGGLSSLRVLGVARASATAGRIQIEFQKLLLPSRAVPIQATALDSEGAQGLVAEVFSSKAWAIAGAMAGSFISGLASAQQTQSVSAFGFTQAQPTGRNALLQGVAQTAADQSRRFVEDSTAEKPVLVVEPGAEVSVLIQEEVRF
jgi:hypothetical protein